MRPSERRFWAKLAAGLVALYLGLCGLVWFASDTLIFQPARASAVQPEGAVHWRTAEGQAVVALGLPNPAARFTLWYFHGNAEALADIVPRLEAYRKRGYAVFAVEYPGYGGSEGRAGERSVFVAAEAGRRYLRGQLQVPAERTVIYGRSLGGGPAVEQARREAPAALVLESAFVSAYRVMTGAPVLLGDKFRNLAKLPAVTSPVLVIHGRQDRVVSFGHGEALFAAAAGHKRSLWLDAAGHNDVLSEGGTLYWETLDEFLAEL